MKTGDLIGDLLREPDDDRRWDALTELVKSTPSEAAVAALAALDSEAPRRETAADVLGQVVGSDPSAADEIAPVLASRLAEEGEPDVIQSLVVALGHAAQPIGRAEVLGLVAHADAGVRHAVAFTLPSLGLDDPALAALRTLSADPDDDVRDWATFALAQSDATDAETVAALAARADDPHDDTRAEAILGLARRRDPRALALCEREMARPIHGSLIEDALAFLA